MIATRYPNGIYIAQYAEPRWGKWCPFTSVGIGSDSYQGSYLGTIWIYCVHVGVKRRDMNLMPETGSFPLMPQGLVFQK